MSQYTIDVERNLHYTNEEDSSMHVDVKVFDEAGNLKYMITYKELPGYDEFKLEERFKSLLVSLGHNVIMHGDN